MYFIPTPRGTLIFLYMRKLGLFFGGFKILNFNIFGVSEKANIFWGMKILWIFFLGHHKIVCLFVWCLTTHQPLWVISVRQY